MAEIHDGFLADICGDVKDDAVRLIYADYLEEHDDPRGEFVRTQVELHRLGEPHKRYNGPHAAPMPWGVTKEGEEAIFLYSVGGGYWIEEVSNKGNCPPVGTRWDLVVENLRPQRSFGRSRRRDLTMRHGLLVDEVFPHPTEPPESEIFCVRWKEDDLSRPFPYDRYNDLRARQSTLLEEWLVDWRTDFLARLATILGYPYPSPYTEKSEEVYHAGLMIGRLSNTVPGFRRGCVAEIETMGDEWLQFHGALCAAAPLEKVTLTTWENRFAKVLLHLCRPRMDAAALRRLTYENAFKFLWPDLEFVYPESLLALIDLDNEHGVFGTEGT